MVEDGGGWGRVFHDSFIHSLLVKLCCYILYYIDGYVYRLLSIDKKLKMKKIYPDADLLSSCVNRRLSSLWIVLARVSPWVWVFWNHLWFTRVSDIPERCSRLYSTYTTYPRYPDIRPLTLILLTIHARHTHTQSSDTKAKLQ